MAKQSSFNPNEYVSLVEAEFSRHQNAVRAAGAKAYMRGQFEFYGMPTPYRRLVQKKFHATHARPPYEQISRVTKLMWNKPQRELHYFALELLEKYKKQFTPGDIPLFEFLITHNSWWDTVDFIAPKLIASLHLSHPEIAEDNCNRWIHSGNSWLMRSAIIHQLLYKKKTNEQLLYRMILTAIDHPDFFIRKAIGWSLRQYAKTNPESVIKFLKSNKNQLSPLSYREAAKHLF